MQPEINSYACTACGREYTTRQEMTICPRCNSEGGWEEILILIEKQPAQSAENPASPLAKSDPLTLDGPELEMLAQALSEFHDAAEQLLTTLQPKTPEQIKQKIGVEKAFDLLIKIETEIERRHAIAAKKLHALRKTA